MFQIQDVLIPGRFVCFILQLLLTISVAFGHDDFLKVGGVTQDSDIYKDNVVRFSILESFFLLFEIIEFFILLSGYTLFINLLSFVQIFLHSVAVIILNFFIRDVWESKLIYIPFIIGGVIPGILEILNIIILCSSNRTISKIK
jgi:hypothetical protein